MQIPEHLIYTDQHLWITPEENGLWIAGVTDYAQDLLGDIVFVEAPAVGATLSAGKPCGLVESVKTGSDLHAPLDGTVESVNESLQGNPELINDKPYSAWIFKFRPDSAADADKLLTPLAYRELLQAT